MALLCLALSTPAVMLADADGFYCVTSRYLAYEIGLPGQAPHELRVVSLAPPLSELSLRAIELPDFQVHGLLCTADEVHLLGWDSLHAVVLDPSARPRSLRSERLVRAGHKPPGFVDLGTADNLGPLARERILPITTFDANFFLVTHVAATEQECTERVVSSLEETDHEGLLRFSLPLYSGMRGVECAGTAKR